MAQFLFAIFFNCVSKTLMHKVTQTSSLDQFNQWCGRIRSHFIFEEWKLTNRSCSSNPQPAQRRRQSCRCACRSSIEANSNAHLGHTSRPWPQGSRWFLKVSEDAKPSEQRLHIWRESVQPAFERWCRRRSRKLSNKRSQPNTQWKTEKNIRTMKVLEPNNTE